MARYFGKNDNDPVVTRHIYNNIETEIRCNSEGVFYVEFHNPLLLIKDRSQPKLRKEIERVLLVRGNKLSIPFVRIQTGSVEVEYNTYLVTEMDSHHAYYEDQYHRRRVLTFLYDGEQYLRVLSREERLELDRLHQAVRDAAKALETWTKAREFDLADALEKQKRGDYPTLHVPMPEWDDDDPLPEEDDE